MSHGANRSSQTAPILQALTTSAIRWRECFLQVEINL